MANTHTETSIELFNLIHTLSKGEKRYFKLYVRTRSAHLKGINYILLFDAVGKQKEYNEEKIKKLGIVKRGHLPMLKNYLYNLILESLRVLNSKGENIDNKLSNMLHNARIMRDKGLTEEEIKFLKKAKELSTKHERWGALLDTLMMEMGTSKRRVDAISMQSTEEEMQQLLTKLSNMIEYLRLSSKTALQVHKSTLQRNTKDKTLQKLFAHPLLKDANKALTSEAKKTYYNTAFVYYIFIGDFKRAYSAITQLRELIETNYTTLTFPALTYSFVLNRLAIIQHHLGKNEELLSTIKKHRALVNKPGPVSTHAFAYSFINETNHYLTLGEFEKGTTGIKNIEKELDKIKSEVPATALYSLYGNITLLYFGIENYRQSLIWANKIINLPKGMIREDIQAWTRILHILIHYELKTPDILEYLIVSTYRFLLRRKHLFKVEQGILGFIRRLSKIDNSQKALLTEFSRFRVELIQITKDPEEKKAMLYFDLIAWLESKIENKQFSEIIKKAREIKTGKRYESK